MGWRRGQTAILTQQYFFLILAGLLNRGSLRAQSPLSAAGSQFGILSPTDSSRLGHLVISLFNVHLLPLFFCLFIQVHLLIDGSVEGQYITRLRGQHPSQRGKAYLKKKCVLAMRIHCIWQQGSSSGKYEVHLQFHYSQVHSDITCLVSRLVGWSIALSVRFVSQLVGWSAG